MPLMKIKTKAQITLPSSILEGLGIKEGDYLDVSIEGNKVVLTPQPPISEFPIAQLSEEGERMLQEALDDVRDGRIKEHENLVSLLEELQHEAH